MWRTLLQDMHRFVWGRSQMLHAAKYNKRTNTASQVYWPRICSKWIVYIFFDFECTQDDILECELGCSPDEEGKCRNCRKVCVDLINMNLICTLPNVYVLPALISKFPLQVNVSIAVKMKLSLEETTHQICFVNGYYLKNIMELRFYIIISKAMHRRST
jgi:hypothetical protein